MNLSLNWIHLSRLNFGIFTSIFSNLSHIDSHGSYLFTYPFRTSASKRSISGTWVVPDTIITIDQCTSQRRLMIMVRKYNLSEVIVKDQNILLRFLRNFWRFSVLWYVFSKEFRIVNPSFNNMDLSLVPLPIRVSTFTRASGLLRLNTIRLVVSLYFFKIKINNNGIMWGIL